MWSAMPGRCRRGVKTGGFGWHWPGSPVSRSAVPSPTPDVLRRERLLPARGRRCSRFEPSPALSPGSSSCPGGTPGSACTVCFPGRLFCLNNNGPAWTVGNVSRFCSAGQGWSAWNGWSLCKDRSIGTGCSIGNGCLRRDGCLSGNGRSVCSGCSIWHRFSLWNSCFSRMNVRSGPAALSEIAVPFARAVDGSKRLCCGNAPALAKPIVR